MLVLLTSHSTGSSEQARPWRTCNRPERHDAGGGDRRVVQALFSSLLSGLYVEDQVTVTEDRIQRYPRLLPQPGILHRFSVLCRAGRHSSDPEAPGPQVQFLPGPLDLGRSSPATVSTGSSCHWTRCPDQGCLYQNSSLSGLSGYGVSRAIIPALRGLRQENCCKFKASLGFVG